MSSDKPSRSQNLLVSTLLASQSILLTLSVHIMALLFGMWPLFNMVVWSFFYTTFYGSTAQAFLSVTFFLCLQGVMHSLLEGLYKTATSLLASFHAQNLRSILLNQLATVVPSQKALYELEQSFVDCENYFSSLYSVSTGILFQAGNVLGNLLNLYHCALLPFACCFYGVVTCIDLLFFHAANNSSPYSLESLSLKQKNDKTIMRQQVADLQTQAPFLAGTPNKRTWVCASLEVLNRGYVKVCAWRYAVKDFLNMVQNFINEAMYPVISIILILFYKIPFPLSFGKDFPLTVTSMGSFVQILESFAQLFRNGSFRRRNLNAIVTHRNAASNLNTLTSSWSMPTPATPVSSNTFSRLPLLLMRNSIITFTLYSAMALFTQLAIASSISLTNLPVSPLSRYLWPFLVAHLVYVTVLYYQGPRKKTSVGLGASLLEYWQNADWDSSLFSILSAFYAVFFIHLFFFNIAPSLMLPAFFVSTGIFTVLSPAIVALFNLFASAKYPQLSTKISLREVSHAPTSSITLKKLSSTLSHRNHKSVKTFAVDEDNTLSFIFGETYLIQGHSGIGKSSLLIPALSNPENLPVGLQAEVKFTACRKIVFSQLNKPLENIIATQSALLTLFDQAGKRYSNTPLKQLFYSLALEDPNYLTPEDHKLLRQWPVLKSHIIDFLVPLSSSFSDLGITSTLSKHEHIPSLLPKERVLLSCAVLYAVLSIHQCSPSYPRIMLLLDEGLDCLSDPEKQCTLTQLRSATNRSQKKSLFICVMHKLEAHMRGVTFDNLVSISKQNNNENIILAHSSKTS